MLHPAPRFVTTVTIALAAATLVGCTGVAEEPTAADSSVESWSPDLLTWRDTPGPFATPVDAGDSVTVDVGNDQTVTLDKDEPPHFIYFLQGTSNTYLQAEADGAEAAADALGVKLTLVNAEFDAATQLAQIQNALSSGKYNGAAIRPVSSTGSCKTLTEDAPQAGVPVIVVVQLSCGRDNESGLDMWAPGTLAYVGGGGGSFPFYQQWAEGIASSMDSPTKTALIVGPGELGAVQVTVEVLEEAAKAHPNMEIVDVAYTDFTDAGGLTAVQNLLQANPDLGAVVLQYGGQTPAVIRGIKQAGKTGSVEVYEAGGDQNAKQELEDSTLTMSAAQAPYSAAYCAVEMLAAVHEGTKVPRVVYNDCNSQAGDLTTTKPLFLTKDNVSDYIPDY
jgi:ribose transport system substrate-binding protein